MPLAAWPLPSAQPAARRTIRLFGSAVELWWLPDRARRRPPTPPLVLTDRAPAILAREVLWRDGDAALTPNRYPFAVQAGILWSTAAGREASAALLDLAFGIAEPHGSALLNTIGAAATQPRAHVHVVGERLPFLSALPTVRVDGARIADGQWPGVDFVRLAAPFPGLVLGVRGARADRARAAARLLALRATPAANLVSDGDTTWFVPRRRETPAPHFPAPLGCAELWGRFCYEDEAAFA